MHTLSLPYRIELMIDHLDSMWQRSIAVNCWLYINQAEQSLNDKLKSIGNESAGIKQPFTHAITMFNLISYRL